MPYQGFEASDHLPYPHACPNRHLLALLDWTCPAYSRRAYLTGSNYIWGGEKNRLAGDIVTAAGGPVLGERYLPIGSPVTPSALSAEINALRSRLAERRRVVRAVMKLAARGKSEPEAYAQRRNMAMDWRLSFAAAAQRIVGGDATLNGGTDDRRDRC